MIAFGDPLRVTRRELAQEARVLPHMVFRDAVLRDMAAQRPATREALGRIVRVSQRKLEA